MIKILILVGLLAQSFMGFSQNTHKKDAQFELTLVDTAHTTNNTVTVTAYKLNSHHFVYAAGDGGYLDAFQLHENGRLTSIESYELNKGKGPGRGIVAAQISDNHYLFVGNKGGNAVEIFRIQNDGKLKRVFLLEDNEETYLGTVITLQVVHMKQASYLFVGGLEQTPGLSCFRIESDGKLNHVQSMKDDDKIHTDGIIGMYVHKINGKTFLFTGGFQDNGISSFRVYQDGHFENINNIADNTTDRYLTGAYPVNGVTLGDNHYVIVGHRHHKYYKRINFIKKKDFVYHGDGVSVFKVNSDGELIPHDILINDEITKLAGQTRIEVLKINESEAYVAVGTRDDQSIQLCKLNKDGKLSPISFLSTGFPIYYGMASKKIGNDYFFLAGSVDNKVKKLFSYKIGDKSNQPVNLKKVLRHVVSINYKDDITEEQLNEAIRDFTNIKGKIPEIISFEWGLNNSTEGHSKGFTHGFILTFKDETSRDTYLNHPEHLLLVERVKPLIEDLFVIDFWVENSLAEKSIP